jgi:hypothetical protein
MKLRYILAGILFTTTAIAASENLSGVWRNKEKDIALTVLHNPETKEMNVSLSISTEEGGTVFRTFKGEDVNEGSRKLTFLGKARGWNGFIDGQDCEAGKATLIVAGTIFGDYGVRELRAEGSSGHVTLTVAFNCDGEMKMRQYNLSGRYR